VAHARSDPSPSRRRAGCTVLALLAGPLCAPVLRAHLDGPLRLPDLSEEIEQGSLAGLRTQVVRLRDIGALERHALKQMPYTVENELTEAGRGILAVADVVEAWLSRAPEGPIALGSEPAKDAIRALVGGWESTILHELAARPLSLTELDGVIVETSYPSLERRLSAMRAARQLEALTGGDLGSKPHVVTEWTRRAVGPLLAAGRCERLHLAEVADRLTRVDIEAGLLLAVPLVSLPETLSGSCLLAIDTGGSIDMTRRVAGVHVEVESGRVASCASRLEREPRSWALGTVEAWVGLVVDGQFDSLRIGGEDPSLMEALIEGLDVSLRNV
jgi:DNA-binding HxlR family transcriptional regulator